MLFLRFFLNLWCFLWCFLGSATIAFGSESAKSVPPAKQLHCWRIQQKNSFFGDCTVYACSEAVKIVFKSGKYMNLARAPGWELFVFNPGGKIYCRTALDKWKANGLQLDLATSSVPPQLVRTGQVQTVCGLVAVEVVPKSVGAVHGRDMESSYWVARDLHLPDQICHILCGNGMLPMLHAVPLKVCTSSTVGNTMETTSASKIDLANTFFDMPKGYKETKDPQEVMNSGIMDVVKDMTGY
jgi:hypothetical protein